MNKRKAISIFLVLALLLSMVLVGCEDKKNGEVGKNESEQSGIDEKKEGKDENEQNDDSKDDKEKLTWETADLSWKKDTSPITMSCYIDFTWYPLDKWGEDDVSKEITKRTGVTLDVTKASNPQQLQTMVAGGDLPDIVFGAGLKTFERSDVSYAFDELMKEHCPEFLDIIDPIEIANNTVSDGHFYTLKTHWKTKEQWDDPRCIPSVGDVGTFIREDIYEELGKPSLETVDDFEKLLLQVKEKYPKMIPWLMRPQYGESVMEWFGLAMGVPVKYENRIINGITHPEFKEYYKFMNRMFREGLFSEESFAYQFEQYKQIRNSGDVFCFTDDTLRGDEVNKFFDDNGIKGHYVPIMKPLTVDGEKKYKPVDRGIGWADCFITKNAKDPRRAILYMEFLKSPEGDQLTQWGIEGKHYTLDKDGMIVRPEGYENWDVKQTGIFPWYFMGSGFAEAVKYYSDKANNPKYSQYVDLLVEIKKHYERDPALYFCNPEPETEESELAAEVKETTTNAHVQIITAPSEVEAMERYEKLISDMKEHGNDELEEFYNEQYEKAKKRYEDLTGTSYDELFK